MQTAPSSTFDYIRYDQDSTDKSEAIRQTCLQLEKQINDLGPGRYTALAKTHLEITFMMVGKQIRDNQISRLTGSGHDPSRG